MMRRIRLLALYLLLVACMAFSVHANCVGLSDTASSSTTLCEAQYDVEVPVVLTGSNYVFDCNGATLFGDSMTPAFILNGTNEVTLKNCNIDGSQIGIYVDNSEHILLSDNTVANAERGIYITDSSNDVTLRTNVISLSAREAIGVNGNTHVLEANELFDNFYGVYVYNHSSAHTLRYNRLNGNTFGAVVEGTSNVIELNGFDDNGEALRLLETENNNVIDNRMFGSRSNGVFVYQSSGNVFEGNNVSSNDKSGLVLMGSAQNTFTNNAFVSNLAAGVFLTAQSHENSFKENTFDGNGVYGLNINSSDLSTVAENFFNYGPFVIEDNSLGTNVCPGNIYAESVIGPLCDHEVKVEGVVVPTPVALEEQEAEEKSVEVSAPIVPQQEVPVIKEETVVEEIAVNDKATNSMGAEAKVKEADSAFAQAMQKETQVQSLDTDLTTKDIQTIVDEILRKDDLSPHDSVLAKKELIEKIRKTEKKVLLSKNIKTTRVGDDIYTAVNTTVRVTANMADVHIYENIPKECAQTVEHLQFGVMNYPGVTFEVIKADPLVVWKFPHVQKGDEITVQYTVKSGVSEVPRTLMVESPDNVINIRQELVCNKEDSPKTLVLAQKIRIFSWMMIVMLFVIILVPIFLVKMSRSNEGY